MPLIDDEGRIFGKFNLIDVIIGAVFIGAIPISYGAFVLFRTPDPSILSIEPTQVTAGESNTVQLTGTFLSPSLRIVIGDTPAEAFLVASQESAEIRLPDLPAGTYDIVLMDQAMEMSRLANPLIVQSPDPLLGLQLAEAVMDVIREDWENLVSQRAMAIRGFTPTYLFSDQPGTLRLHGAGFRPGLSARFVSPGVFTATGEQYIQAPGQAVIVSPMVAEITVPALPEGVYDVVLIDNALTEHARSTEQFSVIATSTTTSRVRITVRFVNRPDMQITMTVGDKDVSMLANGLGVDYLPNSNTLATLPAIVTERIAGFLAQVPEDLRQRILGVLRDSSEQTAQETWAAALAGDQREQRRIIDILNREDQRGLLVEVAEVQSVGPRRTMSGSATYQLRGLGWRSGYENAGPAIFSEPIMEVFDAVVDVPVTLTRLGWSYGGQPIKVGGVFEMETLGYAAQGWVLDLESIGSTNQRP